MGIFILIIAVFVAGSIFGFMLGFSRAMREAASRVHGTRRPTLAWILIVLGCVALIGAFGTTLYTWHFTRIASRFGFRRFGFLPDFDLRPSNFLPCSFPPKTFAYIVPSVTFKLEPEIL